MRVLLVDNYDSFTWNLAHLVAAVTGALPRVVRNDELSPEALLDWEPQAILLSPGPGSPSVDGDVGVCRELVRRAIAIPLLGVCLGHQAIAVALGGVVTRAPMPMHGRVSPVTHDGRGLFAGLPPRLQVVRYHSLAIDPLSLPAALRVTARSDDGVAMAIEHETRPLFGVQFHPESILSDGGQRLLANFFALANLPIAPPRHRPRPRAASTNPPAPMFRERQREVPWIDPERAFTGLFADTAHAFWLDGTGRFSYLGDGGGEVIRVRGGRIEHETTSRTDSSSEADTDSRTEAIDGDAFTEIERLLAARAAAPDPARPFELSSGFVGWLGYGLSALTGGAPRPPDPLALPDALLMRADRVLVFDRARQVLTLSFALAPDQPDALADAWFDDTTLRLAALPPLSPLPRPAPISAPIRLRLARGRALYMADVARIHELLLDGETYEICLTTQVSGASQGLDPLTLHRMLRRSNPAPWSAFLRFPGGAIVSASPERFVHVSRDRVVESRPIKGTRPRGADPAADDRLRHDLATAEKDRAENLMIVDLVRNDLGRVCEPGSVEVPALMEVEAHPTVFQLVSTVRGRLADEVSPVAAVRALFPGGSMTGAPKIRAMRIIDEIEGAPRGVYAGGIGFFSSDGVIDLAMAIRTVVFTGDELRFGIGGAVVALSDAAAEYEEALAKGRALVRAIAAASGGCIVEDEPEF